MSFSRAKLFNGFLGPLNVLALFEDVRLTLYEIVKEQKIFGPERGRTADLLNANQALYQLSYRPR